MDLNETLKLIDAGFTADEIRALANEKPEEGAVNDAPEEKPEEGSATSKEGSTDTETSASVKELNETIKKLSETVNKMQAENIKNARVGSADVHADPIKEKMDEFLKGL